MVKLNLLPRPTEGIIVCRDAGVPHPPNDIDADRTFTVGEQICVRLNHPGPLRQHSLHADIIGVDENGLVARARHDVYRATERGDPDNPVVKFNTVFQVPRECVFTVTKPSGLVTKTPEAIQVYALLIAALKVVDCSVPHGDGRDVVPSSLVRDLHKIAEDFERHLRSRGN